ncbi:uncharacterized protein PG986_003614 [Apiospora aurea]|uniref:Fungal N-terminal domain-containing protein n=1 Tax=Apiospora aurea TaxID=335848 RepID=A0ABR1QST7_9PEZI
MADPVSLALGIAPLCLTAIKGFTLARSTIRLLRHHKRELKRLKTAFVTQTHIFLDECHLLLQEVIDPDDVIFMIEDTENDLWNTPGLDTKIQGYLGRKHSDVKEVIADINEQVQELDESLHKTSNASGRVVKLTATERANEPFRVMLQKSSWEGKLENIKDLNQELRRLRKMAAQVHARRAAAQTCSSAKMPKTYRDMGNHARSLSNAIKYCWSCTETLHVHHLLGLTLESPNGHDLHVLFSCQGNDGIETRVSPINMTIRPQRLPSRSRATVRFNPTALPVKADWNGDHATQLKMRMKTSAKWARKVPSQDLLCNMDSYSTASSTSNETVAGSLSVSSVESRSTETTLLADIGTMDEHPAPIDLRKSLDICGTFYSLAAIPRGTQCYIDTPDNLRHVFGSSEVPAATKHAETFPVLHIFRRALDADLPVPQQLRLVLQITQAMLKLHATPWWKQYWSLSDLSYMEDKNGSGDLAECLRTLHVGTCLDFPSEIDDDAKMITADGSEDQSHDTDSMFEVARLQHGIRNLTLYSLGVVLLQIGRWSAQISADDVVAVRKLASKHNARLGPRYRDLTLRCIECDFGQGSDLSSPQLQDAVYGSVICELESLTGVLEAK